MKGTFGCPEIDFKQSTGAEDASQTFEAVPILLRNHQLSQSQSCCTTIYRSQIGGGKVSTQSCGEANRLEGKNTDNTVYFS